MSSMGGFFHKKKVFLDTDCTSHLINENKNLLLFKLLVLSSVTIFCYN